MSVTESDIRTQMEELFTIIDVNHNGKLEPTEVKNFTKRLHEQQNPGVEFDEDAFTDHFESMDKNADGTISKHELLNSLIEKARVNGTLAWTDLNGLADF